MFELREVVRYGQEHSETYANQFRSDLTVKSHILHALHNIDDMDVNNR
jgi:succinate dehydrogenase/fumarate reductase-like Fe-S protein